MPSLFKNFFTNYKRNQRNFLLKLTKSKLKQLIRESLATSLLEGMCGPDESGQWVDGQAKFKCVKKCAPKGSANLMGLPECPPEKDDEDQDDKKKAKRKKRTKKNSNSQKSKIKCKYIDRVHGRCKDKKQNFGSKNESRLQLEFEAPSNESGLLKQLEDIVNKWPSRTPEGKEYEEQIIELIKQKNPNFKKEPTTKTGEMDYS